MDQELVAYFDRRFSEFKQELKQELKQDLRDELGQEFRTVLGGLRTEVGGVRDEVGGLRDEVGGLRGEVGGVRDEVGGVRSEFGDLRGEFSGFKQEIREEIARTAAETRLHFDTVAERLMDKIQLVGEGVIGVDQKVDRFRGEVADDFHKLDRRLLRLEARVIG